MAVSTARPKLPLHPQPGLVRVSPPLFPRPTPRTVASTLPQHRLVDTSFAYFFLLRDSCVDKTGLLLRCHHASGHA
jgi:hypothetical protein